MPQQALHVMYGKMVRLMRMPIPAIETPSIRLDHDKTYFAFTGVMTELSKRRTSYGQSCKQM